MPGWRWPAFRARGGIAAAGRSDALGKRLFQNVTNRLLEKTVSGIGWVTVSLLQMTLNPRFHEPALTGFEIGYNRSRREYDHAAGTLQI